jgi:hypothetical protein
MAARITREYQDVSGHQECARGSWCSASTRDDEGEWHPHPATQHLCPADQDLMATYLGELPAMYERLAERLTDPARRDRPVRVSPGSRVLVSGDADELMHDIADWIGGWAVRVRALPQLRLSPPGDAYGTTARIACDCDVLAKQRSPMLALPPAKALRTWTFPPPRHALPPARPLHAWRLPPRPAAARPRPEPCRKCGLLVVPSPSGKYWWPAQCTHAGPPLPAGRRDDDTGKDDHLLCAACGTPLPPGRRPPPACRHKATAVPLDASPIPAKVEAEIDGLEVVAAGDGWVSCLTFYDGRDAALDIFDLRAKAMRILHENPAPADLLDGIPCRSCDAMPALEMLPAPQPDPEREAREGEPDFCRCTRCGDRMTRSEYEPHVKRYEAWARGAGIQSCRRCARGECGSCQWKACGCRASGHPAAA